MTIYIHTKKEKNITHTQNTLRKQAKKTKVMTRYASKLVIMLLPRIRGEKKTTQNVQSHPGLL